MKMCAIGADAASMSQRCDHQRPTLNISMIGDIAKLPLFLRNPRRSYQPTTRQRAAC
jgi:hypothetical protein